MRSPRRRDRKLGADFQHEEKAPFLDAYMIYGEDRGCIVDYLGTHQHLAVDIDASVAPNGASPSLWRTTLLRGGDRPSAFHFSSLELVRSANGFANA